MGLQVPFFSFAVVAWFSLSATKDAGIACVLHAYGPLYISLWVIMPRALKYDKSAFKVKEEKITSRDFLNVLKFKAIYFATFAVFATVCFYQSSSYLFHYFPNVYEMSPGHAGIIGMVRAYVSTVFIAPSSVFIADKIGSAIKVMK